MDIGFIEYIDAVLIQIMCHSLDISGLYIGLPKKSNIKIHTIGTISAIENTAKY